MSGRRPLTLDIALARHGHTAALRRGEVAIAGVRANYVEAEPIIGAFRRMVRELAYDVCEMAPATYLVAREAGAAFKALPVFVFRRFHHAGIVCREGAGITGPRDLEGRRVGVRAWSVSTGIWTRGILADEYGLDIGRVQWIVDDEEHVESLRLPPNVRHAPPGRSLAALFDAGELDAAFTGNAGIGRAGAPRAGWQAGATPAAAVHPELLRDAARLEAAWFRRTGIYPVHGLVVVKDALLEAHPWLAGALFEAFCAAKARYLQRLGEDAGGGERDLHYRAMAALVGDPLPYGLEANRPAIEALIRYTHEQGMLARRHAPEDMFVAA